MLEPGAGPAPGLLRPSAPAISLTAHVHASGLNGVPAANEPATTAEAVPASMPCETRSRRLVATPASAAATRMLTSAGASGSRSFKRFAIICGLDKAATPCTGLETITRSAFCASSFSSHWGLNTLTPHVLPVPHPDAIRIPAGPPNDIGFILRTHPAAARGSAPHRLAGVCGGHANADANRTPVRPPGSGATCVPRLGEDLHDHGVASEKRRTADLL